MSQDPDVLAIIPARIASEEVHGKVLVKLGGKTVLQHVYEQVKKSHFVRKIIVAADSTEILEHVVSFGGEGSLTREDHICGSDRCAEIVADHFPDAEIVVNVQADEPFLNPGMIGEVIQPLKEEEQWDVVTLCCPLENREQAEYPFNVKVVRSSADSRALYFSRSLIPFPRYEEQTNWYQHIGIYAYRKEALLRFRELGPSPLEQAEGLEQLRALEAGYQIKVVETQMEYTGIAINTRADIERAQHFTAG